VADAKGARLLFNEYVVGRLAKLIGAPVPSTVLIHIEHEFISRFPSEVEGIGHVRPGMAHGSRFHEGLGERVDKVRFVTQNKDRFASLAILHAWTQANDHHFLYDEHGNVYSVDHGNFLPGGPHWTLRDLGRVDAIDLDHFADACGLVDEELMEACAPLRTISPSDLAEIVATAPDEWSVSVQERLAVAKFLRARQLQLLAICGIEHRTEFGFAPRLVTSGGLAGPGK
jgi:hypothetical protein